jgi:putative ABC transport system ATP-binding protein
MPLIEMKSVKKDYQMGETVVHALNQVNLTIHKGEFVGIWGPSGSGKTTLLNLMGGIDDPSSGLYRIEGREVARLSDNQRSELRNRSIGFIFQGFNLVPVLSALENVMIPLQIQGKPFSEAKKKAFSRLEDVGLLEVVGHRPDKMSGGQQQRVAVARALVTDPALVIADEPTANLDSDNAYKIIQLMHDLNQKEATTFVFSTHDQRILSKVERLVQLEDGQIKGEEIKK